MYANPAETETNTDKDRHKKRPEKKYVAGIFLRLQLVLDDIILFNSISFRLFIYSNKFISSHSFSLYIPLRPQCELTLVHKEAGHLQRRKR